MAFKMKRSNMSLRSTTRIQPQLTSLQSMNNSPIQQNDDDSIVEARFDAGDVNQTRNDDGSINLSGLQQGGDGKIIETEYNPDGGQDPEWEQTCIDNPCLKPCNDQYGQCPDGEDVKDEENYSLTMDEPEVQGNMLTPREMRRNARSADMFRKRQEDLIRRANKDFRQATRRGQSHDPDSAYMKILSGELLGNMDGVNIGQASTGTTNLFTGQKTYKFNPKTGGGKKDLNDALAAETARLIAAKKEAGEKFELSDIKKQATQTVSDNYISSGKVKVFNQGQHLSSRSRSLADNRNYDTSQYGDFGLAGKSQKRRDRDNRQAEQLAEQLAAAQSQFGDDDKFTETEDGISRKKYDRLKRQYNKKTDSETRKESAFKQKQSPINMTVNVTKPSYKMGGFGSK